MDTAGDELGIGGECGGVVTRVGAGVTGVKAGDVVVAVPPDGMGSFLVTREEWVSPPLPWSRQEVAPAKPPLGGEEHHTHATASPVPYASHACLASGAVADTIAYATAWLGLVHGPGRVRPGRGEVVLLHSAAGGVGLAALNLLHSTFVNGDLSESCSTTNLQCQPCVVYGTASTPEKRELLLKLGCAGAFDSRDPDAFTRGVLEMESARLFSLASVAKQEALKTRKLAAQAKVELQKVRGDRVLSKEKSASARSAIRLAAAATNRARDTHDAATAAATAVSAHAAHSLGGDSTQRGSSPHSGGVVDVVLGAVTGAAFQASVGLLKPFGRYVELGKRGGYENYSMSMSPFLLVRFESTSDQS